MADVTVSQFAEALKVPVDKLLTQLDQAGINVAGPEGVISEDAKLELLTHLRRSHGSGAAGARSAPERQADQRAEDEPEGGRGGAREGGGEDRGRPAHARGGKMAGAGREEGARPEPGGGQELHIAGDVSARHKKKKRLKARTAPADSEPRHGFEKPTAPVKREVAIGATVTVADLAQKLAIKATEAIKVLMNMGAMATINQAIDQDTAILVVEELGHSATALKENQIEADLQDSAAEQALETRAPVVTVMGHVH